VTFSPARLRAIVNLLADPLQASAAAHALTQEANRRRVLVADLVAEATVPAPSSPPITPDPAPSTAPTWQDTSPIDDPSTGSGQADGATTVRRINADYVGLIARILHETEKAWLIATPAGKEAWLAKSPCQYHGDNGRGRAILIVPNWLAGKIGLTPPTSTPQRSPEPQRPTTPSPPCDKRSRWGKIFDELSRGATASSDTAAQQEAAERPDEERQAEFLHYLRNLQCDCCGSAVYPNERDARDIFRDWDGIESVGDLASVVVRYCSSCSHGMNKGTIDP
jgi:hypothetical protein